MKRRTFQVLLVVEALACVLLVVAKVPPAVSFSGAIAFPFEQIGRWLRSLSLSGWEGNAAATVIYVLISLTPLGALLVFRKRRKLYAEDRLLVLLSAALFAVLYMMINPGQMGRMAGTDLVLPGWKMVLGVMIYSLLCGYLILRVLRLFCAGSMRQLQRYMAAMLGVLNVIFVFAAFGLSFSELIESISALRAGNMGDEHLLGMSYIFLFLRCAVSALPYLLNVFVVFSALNLLDEMHKDQYSSGTVMAAQRMSRVCVRALTITTLSGIGFNVLQSLLMQSLRSIDSTVEIPLMSILFILAALLLTRFITENRRLKEENEQFI